MTEKPKTYRVTAATGYHGHQLGDEFDADLDEAAERRALERGSIEIVKKTGKAKTDQEDDNDG